MFVVLTRLDYYSSRNVSSRRNRKESIITQEFSARIAMVLDMLILVVPAKPEGARS